MNWAFPEKQNKTKQNQLFIHYFWQVKFFYLPANQMNYIKLTPRCCMVTPDKLIMEGNWFPIYPHSQLGIRYTGNRKMPVARRNKEGPQVMYKWRPLLYNIDRCRSYLTRHPWSPHFRKKWHEFHCNYYYQEVHYTACEGMDCFFKFNVFLFSWIYQFLLPFLSQKAAWRISTNLYQLYVYWYSYKVFL